MNTGGDQGRLHNDSALPAGSPPAPRLCVPAASDWLKVMPKGRATSQDLRVPCRRCERAYRIHAGVLPGWPCGPPRLHRACQDEARWALPPPLPPPAAGRPGDWKCPEAMGTRRCRCPAPSHPKTRAGALAPEGAGSGGSAAAPGSRGRTPPIWAPCSASCTRSSRIAMAPWRADESCPARSPSNQESLARQHNPPPSPHPPAGAFKHKQRRSVSASSLFGQSANEQGVLLLRQKRAFEAL